VGIRVKSVNLSNLSSGQICQAVRILLALRGELDGAASSALRFDFGDGGSQGDGEAKKRAQGDCGGVQGQWSAPGGKKTIGTCCSCPDSELIYAIVTVLQHISNLDIFPSYEVTHRLHFSPPLLGTRTAHTYDSAGI
jgi:hypothetical protein